MFFSSDEFIFHKKKNIQRIKIPVVLLYKNNMFVFLFLTFNTLSLRASHRLKTSLHEYKMKKQEVFPSGLSKASSPRSPVWYQVSVCMRRCVYVPILLYMAACDCTNPAVRCVFLFFLNKGFALRDVVITLCLCVLMSHPASGLRENIEVRISKANDLLGSFKLLLLQLEADDVFANKTSATEETACGVTLPLSPKKNLLFSFSFLSVSLCVYAPYSFMCLYMK